MNFRKPRELIRLAMLGLVFVVGVMSIIGSSPFTMNSQREKTDDTEIGVDSQVAEVSHQIEAVRADIQTKTSELKAIQTIHNVLVMTNAAQEDQDRHSAQIQRLVATIEDKNRTLAGLENEKQELLSQSSGCFPPGALVKMDDGSFKQFDQIHPGDRVLTYDTGYEKHLGKQVLEVYSVAANHLYTINGEFMTTGGERLLSGDGWKEVRNLKKGDLVHVNGRMREVVSIEYSRVNNTLHNMQVNDTHNFYVVTPDGSQYLVHNCGGGGGK